ncbi:hypothetical protein GCM10007978_49710 [Shewanella hanedai]|nr:hypothetical protein GCM10007978_49710 [Shewanella hanedai]
MLDSGGYSHYGVSDTDSAGRVSAPQRLHVAFHYKTPTGYLSDREILDFISGNVDRTTFLSYVLEEEADERFFEMMTNYSAKCKEDSFDVLSSIYDAFLYSTKLVSSLENNYGFMTIDPYRQMIWLTNKIISESENKYELIKGLMGRRESTPLAADVLYKIREQIHDDKHRGLWVSEEQLKELELDFQIIAIGALTKREFMPNHLESHIFYELERSSKEKATGLMAEILSSSGGAIRTAEIIGKSGSDSTNGPFVQIDEKTFADVINLESLREKVKEIDIQSQAVHIQAALKSILDGKKYYLRDGKIGGRW